MRKLFESGKKNIKYEVVVIVVGLTIGCPLGGGVGTGVGAAAAEGLWQLFGG